MAYAIVKHDLACTGMVSDHRSEFLIDAEEDLVNIVEPVAPGSVAKMADGSKEFVMSPSRQWVEQVGGSEGGGGGGEHKTFVINMKNNYTEWTCENGTFSEIKTAMKKDLNTKIILRSFGNVEFELLFPPIVFPNRVDGLDYESDTGDYIGITFVKLGEIVYYLFNEDGTMEED